MQCNAIPKRKLAFLSRVEPSREKLRSATTLGALSSHTQKSPAPASSAQPTKTGHTSVSGGCIQECDEWKNERCRRIT